MHLLTINDLKTRSQNSRSQNVFKAHVLNGGMQIFASETKKNPKVSYISVCFLVQGYLEREEKLCNFHMTISIFMYLS